MEDSTRVHEAEDCREQLRKAKIELTLEREHGEQLERLLNHDPDTGLPQRHLLVRRLMQRIRQKEGSSFAYGIIRLDRHYQRIKYTRDRMKVLLYVTAQRIQSVVGPDNLYQSDRSDEFLFVLDPVEGYRDIEAAVHGIQDLVEESHSIPAVEISFGCHVGVAIYPEHGKNLEELEVNAEIALGIFEQKRDNGFLYSPELGKIFHENEDLVNVMKRCIREGFIGFSVVYQPIMDSQSRLVGCEALMRWNIPGYGAIPPLRFIPLAEQNGFIKLLGKWILFQALQQVRLWAGQLKPDFFVSVNVSALEVDRNDFVDDVRNALEQTGVNPSGLHLELTESMMMEDPFLVKQRLDKLKELGVRIMLDDFGTGYSNFSYLNQLPIDTLKIARELVEQLPTDKRSYEVVRAIMALARSFRFSTLAEGIETAAQHDCLVAEGIDYIQGYYFSPPVDGAEFEQRYLDF